MRELEAFVVAAKTKSFQKASEQLYISPTALMKQINALEEDTGLKLFRRTNRGIFLTEAGEAFYNTVYNILVNYHTGIQNAKNLQSRIAKPVHIGFSPINPYQHTEGKFFYDMEDFSEFTFFMEPISGEYKDFTDEMRNLGSHMDLIPYFCGQIALETMCNTFCLARINLQVAVPTTHPLAAKESLTYEDLNGYPLVTISSEANRYYKVFNEDILAQAPDVKLLPTQFYDFLTLNYAAINQQLILVGGYLKNVHPHLKLCKVNWDHYLPYGFYYSKTPSRIVVELLETYRDCGITGEIEDAVIVDF